MNLITLFSPESFCRRRSVAERLGKQPHHLRRYLMGDQPPGRQMLYAIAAVLDELDGAELDEVATAAEEPGQTSGLPIAAQ